MFISFFEKPVCNLNFLFTFVNCKFNNYTLDITI